MTHVSAVLAVAVALAGTSSFQARAQEARDTDLFRTLQEHDAEFFERGFNRCDLAYLEGAVSDELDFYHDQGGHQDKQAFLGNTRKYICTNTGPKPVRKVEDGSLVVFPLHKDGTLYAAIQSGVHHFYLREPGKPDLHTSSARFTHVYVREGDRWILEEVLSYDHGEAVGRVEGNAE